MIIQYYSRDFKIWVDIDLPDESKELQPWKTLLAKMNDFLAPPRSSPSKSNGNGSLFEDTQRSILDESPPLAAVVPSSASTDPNPAEAFPDVPIAGGDSPEPPVALDSPQDAS